MVAGFEWDPAKRFANLAKHGVDFVDASGIFWRPVLETTDERHAYGEARIIAVGRAAGETLTVVYTWRGTTRRIISARRSNRHEQEAFARFSADAEGQDRLGTPSTDDG